MSSPATSRDAGRPPGRRSRRRSLGQTGLRVGAPIAALAIVVLLWQTGVVYRLFGLEEFTVPKPASIWSTLTDGWSATWHSQATTLAEAVTGYLLGSAAGFGLAMLVTLTGIGRRLLPGIAGALNAVPIVATAPIAVLYLGYGKSSKIAIVAVLTAAVMLLNANKGLNSVDADHLDLMHSYASTRWQTMRKLRVPSALPYVFTALKYNVTLALVGAIIAEFFGGYGGVGIELIQSLASFTMTQVWAAMLLVSATGIVWYQVVTALEWATTRWYPSAR